MNEFFLENADYGLFVAVSAAVCGAMHRRFLRKRRSAALAWTVLAVFLFGGWFLVEHADQRERRRLQQMIEGYAPTYAREMELLGHAEMTPETPADDPAYLKMIEAQKRWMAANHTIISIYTMRQRADGSFVRLVGAEADHDRDGKIAGDLEERTPIGQAQPEVFPAITEAIATNQPRFEKTIYSDRWGRWVSAIVPLHNAEGKVEAVLGADFDASLWEAGIQSARWSTIHYLVLLLSLCTATTVVTAFHVARRDLLLEKIQQKAVLLEKRKLETLVNSIDGIVWECDAETFEFFYVSEQAERILGFTAEEWLATPSFWQSRLHPGDRWCVEHCHRMVQQKRPYTVDYRMLARDERTVWIRESAAVLLDDAGEPALVRGVFRDVTAEELSADELEKANAALIESSRLAGMAEIATGVLHNVGNVLNSINVSGNLISDRVEHSKETELRRIAGLVAEHRGHFASFVATDRRGALIPELVLRVSEALQAERAEISREVQSIIENIAHVKEIVARQQNYAKHGDILEPLDTAELVENALRITAASASLNGLEIVREFAPAPRVLADKHKTLQILVNLLRNARQAMDAAPERPKTLYLSIARDADARVRIGVRDTGIGIAPAHLGRLFSHGFTTKKEGHGFGLHSGAIAAREMGGSLTVSSSGEGNGAHFTLEMPAVLEPSQTN